MFTMSLNHVGIHDISCCSKSGSHSSQTFHCNEYRDYDFMNGTLYPLPPISLPTFGILPPFFSAGNAFLSEVQSTSCLFGTTTHSPVSSLTLLRWRILLRWLVMLGPVSCCSYHIRLIALCLYYLSSDSFSIMCVVDLILFSCNGDAVGACFGIGVIL